MVHNTSKLVGDKNECTDLVNKHVGEVATLQSQGKQLTRRTAGADNNSIVSCEHQVVSVRTVP